ncbi:MAG TPA: MotA/TolQ/ExbB proton channel family protein [Candidatus Binatia bacterium]|jgi:biopolymer transport protein ExbB|nr:MotA/TolQ/ExbB proton channel family protein [Candidatus Binatia bacterium]
MPTNTEATGVWFFIVKGGPVMIPIIALSIVALAIILAKFWELWRFRTRLGKLSRHLQTLVEDGNLSGARHLCREQNSSLGRLLEAALLYRGHERAELTRRLERLGGEVVADLESYMSALATVIGVEPMLGFLGTIVGLIKAFMNWETMGERITINVLAGGIYEAMITTAAGLTIAIPYYLIYNHLVTRVATLTRLTEERTDEFVDLLGEMKPKESVRHAL